MDFVLFFLPPTPHFLPHKYATHQGIIYDKAEYVRLAREIASHNRLLETSTPLPEDTDTPKEENRALQQRAGDLHSLKAKILITMSIQDASPWFVTRPNPGRGLPGFLSEPFTRTRQQDAGTQPRRSPPCHLREPSPDSLLIARAGAQS